MSSGYPAFPADGHTVAWSTWDGAAGEQTTITWENEGWTVVGDVSADRVQYVLRLNATWQVRQFLLFRDLDEPDLWLGTDGHGRWGEINGAHRPELDGCSDLDLAWTPFPISVPIRRLPLHVGDDALVDAVAVDHDTLEVRRVRRRYTRLAPRRWRQADPDGGPSVELDVDEHGVVLDHPDRWRRITPA